jgi:hypothetical protein
MLSSLAPSLPLSLALRVVPYGDIDYPEERLSCSMQLSVPFLF